MTKDLSFKRVPETPSKKIHCERNTFPFTYFTHAYCTTSPKHKNAVIYSPSSH